jgi:hypothetical protein
VAYLSYTLIISLLISKLFCTKGEVGGGAIGRGWAVKSHINHNKQYRIQNTAAAKLMYEKLPMYLFFI